MVFQDPSAALNPLFTVGTQITAVMRRHRMASGGAARRRAAGLLAELGLPEPEAMLERYPHQLSGGMQQRIMLAVALAAEPELIIADEATTALDVTIQAQILELLENLKRERDLTLVFITHDLGLVAEICDRIAVLYMGRVVEEGDPADIFHDPRHPYTKGLLAALPNDQPWRQPLNVIPGMVPSGTDVIAGCAFAPRCPFAMAACQRIDPPDIRFSRRHRAACLLYDEAHGGTAP
jgi:oligopeptide/dipeptide ABC transporter ATP-binding protein